MVVAGVEWGSRCVARPCPAAHCPSLVAPRRSQGLGLACVAHARRRLGATAAPGSNPGCLGLRAWKRAGRSVLSSDLAAAMTAWRGPEAHDAPRRRRCVLRDCTGCSASPRCPLSPPTTLPARCPADPTSSSRFLPVPVRSITLIPQSPLTYNHSLPQVHPHLLRLQRHAAEEEGQGRCTCNYPTDA